MADPDDTFRYLTRLSFDETLRIVYSKRLLRINVDLLTSEIEHDSAYENLEEVIMPLGWKPEEFLKEFQRRLKE